MGCDQVEALLPAHIKAMQDANLPVVWVCDPCHGNTHQAATGYKTRSVDKILLEVERTFEVHAKMGSHLGGVHFELTGENVTECIGGPEDLKDTGQGSVQITFYHMHLLAHKTKQNKPNQTKPNQTNQKNKPAQMTTRFYFGYNCLSDLPERYTTYCDPRLNYAQSMEIAFLLSRLLAKHKQSRRRIRFNEND
jgi:3-deoxy-D-arabino-heptulosonate 7-phosphate (DAHP) synthase class II